MIIEIDKEAIPYQFDIELAGEVFTMEIHYNTRFDFFTVTLYKDDELIVAGEKIVYGNPLFSSIIDERLPKVPIIPIDESGKPVERITWDNFGETVVLLVGEIDG
jgi:hypothetical protein